MRFPIPFFEFIRFSSFCPVSTVFLLYLNCYILFVNGSEQNKIIDKKIDALKIFRLQLEILYIIFNKI